MLIQKAAPVARRALASGLRSLADRLDPAGAQEADSSVKRDLLDHTHRLEFGLETIRHMTIKWCLRRGVSIRVLDSTEAIVQKCLEHAEARERQPDNASHWKQGEPGEPRRMVVLWNRIRNEPVHVYSKSEFRLGPVWALPGWYAEALKAPPCLPTNKSQIGDNVMRNVVVTTTNRGIFVGRTDAEPTSETCVLEQARMVLYYSQETRGVVGLAQRGPQKGSRVSPVATRIGLRNVTSIMDATDAAAAAWESEPWN